MAEHDDGRIPPPFEDLTPSFRGPGRRYITAAEHEALRNRVHQVSNDINAELGKQQSRISVLERRADDEKEHRAQADKRLEELRRECEERAVDTRKYAATLVESAREEGQRMVDQLAKSWADSRKDEREDRRAEASTAMWRIALMVGGLQFLIGLAFTVWKR
jgi:seryl-tRNA synthetase